MNLWGRSIVLMIIAALLASCSGLRSIPEGAYLYTGAEVMLEDEGLEKDKRKKAEGVLTELLVPQANTVFLGMRPGLWVYQHTTDSTKGPISRWLRKTIGQKPVLLSDVNPQKVSAVMENHLFHKGFFNAKVHASEIKRKRTASLVYHARKLKPYTIDSIFWPQDAPLQDSVLQPVFRNSLLKPGMGYSLDLLQAERSRIVKSLQAKGYYFFTEKYLLFGADSTIGDRQVNLRLQFKPQTPSSALRPYYFREVRIKAVYHKDSPAKTSLTAGGVEIVTDGHIRPEVLLLRNKIMPGTVYSAEAYENTYNKLSQLGIFRYIKPGISRYHQTDSLDVYFDLIPSLPMSFNTSIDYATSTNNYQGPGLNLGMKHRNIFGGAEELSLNLNGSYQMQIGQQDEYYFSLGLNSELLFPRFFPFGNVAGLRSDELFTSLKLGGELQDRVGVFTLASWKSSVTYQLSKGKGFSHYFSPIDMMYVRLIKGSPELDSLLNENPYLKQSFENQLIPALWYKIVLNNFSAKGLQSNYYASVKLEVAGNLLYTLAKASQAEQNDEGYYTIAGEPFSQYFRFESDLRYYLGKSRRGRFAFRLFAGAGIPYANAETLPYVKQFYTGGPDGLRAFYARSVGPGTLVPPDNDESGLKNNQTGEVKLELNAEYRFPMAGFLKGALFTDAGNVWMLNDQQGEEARFRSTDFYRELAIGSGIGLRMDFSFLLLRFDLAFPLRKPWIKENNGWVLNKIAPGKASWRRNNLILNIALGYPF